MNMYQNYPNNYYNNQYSQSSDEVEEDDKLPLFSVTTKEDKLKPHAKKSDVFDDFVKDLKDICDKDVSILDNFKKFAVTQKDVRRNNLGNTLCTHTKNDNLQPMKLNALLPGCVDMIIEARKRIMANENEKISIIIEQDGWVGDAKIRPEYKVTIKRT